MVRLAEPEMDFSPNWSPGWGTSVGFVTQKLPGGTQHI